MPRGKIKWFDAKKGFGFIENGGQGQDIFVHFSEIKVKGYRTLADGQEVEYDLATGEKGHSAKNVRPIA